MKSFLNLYVASLQPYWNLTMDSQPRYVYGMILEVATSEDIPEYQLTFSHTNMHVIDTQPSLLYPFSHMMQQYADPRLNLRHRFCIRHSYTF